jgi:hypothetical protein
VQPVFQTKFSLFYSDGSRYSYGNCLVACIATILRVSVDEVPNIYTFYGLDSKPKSNPEDQLWFQIMDMWLEKKHGKRLRKHNWGEDTDNTYVIVRGISKRHKPHTCIYRREEGELKPFFDPHPTGEFLLEEHYFLTVADL